MKVKQLLAVVAISLMSISALAQRTELKKYEELKPGEPVFSKDGKWVLIMENVVGSNYGQYSTFATSNFSLDRNKGIMSSTPKTNIGKTKGKAIKLGFVSWGVEVMEYVTPKTYTILQTIKVGNDAQKMIVENDGTISFLNAKGEKTFTIK